MNLFKYFVLALIVAIPINVYSGTVTQSELDFLGTDDDGDSEVYAVYDLRDRKTYIQVTNEDDDTNPLDNPICIHVQIFQQDKGCVELDFEDSLTLKDTVVYDLDNLVRNDGTAVPVNLDDDSYGFVAVSEYRCSNKDEDPGSIVGNFRIIDDKGFEYRMNMFDRQDAWNILEGAEGGPPTPALSNVIIPFNTVDGAMYSDIFAFVVEDDRHISGSTADPNSHVIYNEEKGVTFSVFQVDENEERISCDQKTIGCGPDIVFNYGINEDFPASRGNNLLCEGAGLNSGQTNGYISLENASFLSPLELTDEETGDFEFVCVVGLNNGDGTGSMDECKIQCIDESNPICTEN